MALTTQIPFQKLLTSVRNLSTVQKTRLKQELAEERKTEKHKDDFIAILLNGPVFTEKDIQRVEANRKSIGKWRKKD